MRSKKPLSFLLLLLFPLFSYSQTRFNKVLNPDTHPRPGSGFGIVPLPDGGYLIAATSDPNGLDTDIVIMRTDSAGTIVQQSAIHEDGHRYTLRKNGLKVCPDGTYILGVVDYNSVTWDFLGEMLSINLQGQVLWSRTYEVGGDLNEFLPADVAVQSDSSLILCGYYLDTVNKPLRILLTKTTRFGEIVWQKKFISPVSEQPYQLTLTPDNGIALAVLRQATTPDMRNLVIKLDSTGEFLWEKEVGNTFAYAAPSSIEACPDGSILFVSGQDSISKITNAQAAKLSADGEILWSYTYSLDDTNTAFSTRPVILPDGSFVVAAGRRVGVPPEDDGPLHIVRIGPDGQLIWNRRHQYSQPDKVHDARAMVPTLDYGFILTGRVDVPGIGPQIWLLKTDSLGCADENCNLVDAVEPAAPGRDAISVYPIPFSDALQVASPEDPIRSLTLIGIDGRHHVGLFPTESRPDEPVAMRTDHLPAGMYVLLVRTAGHLRRTLVVKI